MANDGIMIYLQRARVAYSYSLGHLQISQVFTLAGLGSSSPDLFPSLITCLYAQNRLL